MNVVTETVEVIIRAIIIVIVIIMAKRDKISSPIMVN